MTSSAFGDDIPNVRLWWRQSFGKLGVDLIGRPERACVAQQVGVDVEEPVKPRLGWQFARIARLPGESQLLQGDDNPRG